MVRTPKGFKEAYKAFLDGGWAALGSDPEYGGQGLPRERGQAGRGNDLRRQFIVRPVSGSLAWRLPRAQEPRLRGAQEPVPAETGRWQLDRHDVPDRAALRHAISGCCVPKRCRRPTAAISSRGSKIFISRRRTRSHREHRPLGARPPAGCAAGNQRASVCSSFRSSCRMPTASVGARNGVRCTAHRAQDGHQGVRDLPDLLR